MDNEVIKVCENVSKVINDKFADNDNLQIVTPEDVIEIVSCVGLSIRDGARNADNIKIPYFGIFKVYVGPKSLISKVAAIDSLNMTKEEVIKTFREKKEDFIVSKTINKPNVFKLK